MTNLQSRLHELFSYDEDAGALRWKAGFRSGRVAGTLNQSGYWTVNFDGVRHLLHRMIWTFHHGTAPEIVDHINGQATDNRVENLRACARADNAKNRKAHANSASGISGVTVMPSGSYKASIWLGRRQVHLGTFKTPDEAISARNSAVIKYHGEFGRMATLPT